ncbi:hypothetical protein ACOSQ4_014801 [Xanthoceras sorbifolium]
MTHTSVSGVFGFGEIVRLCPAGEIVDWATTFLQNFQQVQGAGVGGSTRRLGDAACSGISGAGGSAPVSSAAVVWTTPARGALKINVDVSVPLAGGVGLGLVI